MNITQILAQIINAPYKDRRTESNGVILLCSVPERGSEAWYHVVHPPLQNTEIDSLEREMGMLVPSQYRELLLVANGLNLFSNHLSFYGQRLRIDRSPGAPRVPHSVAYSNTFERPNHLSQSKFIIGGYFWDGSRICLDRITERVECWYPDFRKIRTSWASLETMLSAEISRLQSHFDENGHWISQERPTAPDDDSELDG